MSRARAIRSAVDFWVLHGRGDPSSLAEEIEGRLAPEQGGLADLAVRCARAEIERDDLRKQNHALQRASAEQPLMLFGMPPKYWLGLQEASYKVLASPGLPEDCQRTMCEALAFKEHPTSSEWIDRIVASIVPKETP